MRKRFSRLLDGLSKTRQAIAGGIRGALGRGEGLSEEVLEGITDESVKMIVLDMKNLTYISSAGIRVLLKTKKHLAPHNGKLTFLNLQPQVKKVFDIIQALPDLRIFESAKELDDYLDVMQKKVVQGDEDI